MLERTLDGMADGGIHDHVGGGFARYSTDAMWFVPHFEKMLYDNAQLLALYAHAAVVTRNDRYRRVAMRIAEWMLREMQQPEGGFSSSMDADSDGVEGAFFVWSWDELVAIVGETVAEALGATPEGNWEGTNVLWLPRPVAEVAAAHGVDETEFATEIDRGLATLFEHRAKRTAPATDDKVVTAWNGLAIGALAIAGSALNEPSLLEAAERCATFIWENLRDPDGRLLRSWRGGTSTCAGLRRRPRVARAGAVRAVRADRSNGVAATRHRARRRVDRSVRGRGRRASIRSGPTPSRWSSASSTFSTSRRRAATRPRPTSSSVSATTQARRGTRSTPAARCNGCAPILERAPTAAGHALRALELHAGPTAEVAIVGDPSGPNTKALLDAVVGGDRYLPNTIVGLADPADARAHDIQLFEGRLMATEATAYVCERFVCQLPVSTAAALRRELANALGSDLGTPAAS